MKKTRTLVLALAAVFFVPYNVSNAEANKYIVTDQPAAMGTSLQEGSPVIGINEDSPRITTMSLVQTETREQMALPSANPAHNIDLSSNSVTVTYSNHESVVRDKKSIPLIINGTLIDSEVIVVNDRALVPLRILTERLGGVIEWDGSAQMVSVYRGYNVIRMTIGSNTVTINDEPQTIDAAPIIHNDYTYLPLRFVSENLGATVSYNTGGYNPATMKFNSYMLVQGFSANVLVDEHDPSWPLISEFQAETTVMNMSRGLYSEFVRNSSISPEKDYPSIHNFVNYCIENTRVVGSASRYYVVESYSLFLFDKYTGIVYVIGSDSQSNWIRRYAEGDAKNYEIFTKGYFIN